MYMIKSGAVLAQGPENMGGSPSLEILKTGLARALSNMDLLWGVGGQGPLEVFYDSDSIQ